jgi:Domain of unknown function (DUF5658)
MGGETRSLRVAPPGEILSAGVCWAIGMAFAVVDAITSWYAITRLHMPEGNPVARWAIEQVGISEAVALRVIISAVVLGVLAVGTWVQVPHHRALINRTCRVILLGALVLWGIVAVSNTAQIAIFKFA